MQFENNNADAKSGRIKLACFDNSEIALEFLTKDITKYRANYSPAGGETGSEISTLQTAVKRFSIFSDKR